MDSSSTQIDQFRFNTVVFKFSENMSKQNGGIPIFSGTSIKRNNFHFPPQKVTRLGFTKALIGKFHFRAKKHPGAISIIGATSPQVVRPASSMKYLSTMESSMKARVYVSLKPTVLDPQGQTICSALKSLGHKYIADVRQGKFFDILLEPDADPAQVWTEMEQIAQDVLANPVIEEYKVEIEK